MPIPRFDRISEVFDLDHGWTSFSFIAPRGEIHSDYSDSPLSAYMLDDRKIVKLLHEVRIHVRHFTS
jgi:hypothetical protein